MVRLAVLGAAVVAALVVALPASSAGGGGSFFVGFADDLPKSIGAAAVAPASAMGARAMRVTPGWRTTARASGRCGSYFGMSISVTAPGASPGTFGASAGL